MPSLQSLVVTDRTTPTPVNLTFVPRDITDGVGSVINSNGVPVGDKRISVSMKKTNTKYKGELRVTLPVVVNETINGVARPTVARTAYATLTVTFDERSSEQERNDMIGIVASALATGKTLVNDTLVKLENVY